MYVTGVSNNKFVFPRDKACMDPCMYASQTTLLTNLLYIFVIVVLSLLDFFLVLPLGVDPPLRFVSRFLLRANFVPV